MLLPTELHKKPYSCKIRGSYAPKLVNNIAVLSTDAGRTLDNRRDFIAQCYSQFGELKYWSQKLLSSVRRTELKEPEITKSSSAI